MKKMFTIIMVLFLILSTVHIPAHADNALKKLGRGIANVFTFPFEVFKGIQDANVEHGYWAACSWGLVQGVAKGVVRALVGTYEIATFPIPLPRDYAPILTDPEFFGESSFYGGSSTE